MRLSNEETFNRVRTIHRESAELQERYEELRELVGRGEGGRELSLAITKLEEAQHWLSACRDRL